MSEQHNNAPGLNFARLGNTGLILAIMGVAVTILSYTVSKETFLSSYVFSYMFWVSLTLGCLGLVTLHHTVRGSWGLATLRLFEAGGGPRMLITFLLLFAPIALGINEVYHHWTHPDPADLILAHKQGYLNVPFFLARTVLYFLVWIGFSAYFKRSTRQDDNSPDPRLGAKRSSWGAGGIIAFVITMTFAITDWVMSLDPHWFSTIYGFLFVIYSSLAALSLATFIITRYKNVEPYKSVVTPALQRDLGNLLFMFTMLWGYMTVSQFLIIWSGNLPEFTSYFANRQGGFWNLLGAFNVFFAFFLPWTALLSPRAKRDTNKLMWLAVLIFVMRIPDWYWIIIPFFRDHFAWTDVTCFLSLGAFWFWTFGKEASQSNLLPAHDQRLVETKKQSEAAHVHA